MSLIVSSFKNQPILTTIAAAAIVSSTWYMGMEKTERVASNVITGSFLGGFFGFVIPNELSAILKMLKPTITSKTVEDFSLGNSLLSFGLSFVANLVASTIFNSESFLVPTCVGTASGVIVSVLLGSCC